MLTVCPARSEPDESEGEKAYAYLEMNYHKNQYEERTVTVTLSTRQDGHIVYIDGEQVSLYLNEVSDSGFVSLATTDPGGRAEFHPGNEWFKSISGNSNEFTLIAGLENSENYFSETVSRTITEASLTVDFLQKDSLRYIKASLRSYDGSMNLVPAEYVEIHLYIKRMLGELPAGGDYNFTDENGEIIIEFPNDLPGNRNGNLDIIVKVEDHENFGNLSYTSSKEWGLPLEFNEISINRSLVGSRANAPMILIIISNIIILGVWIIIAYLIIQIVRIRKLNRKNQTE